MLKRYFPYIAPFLLLLVFFIDGQLSSLAINLAPQGIFLTSHLLLIVGLVCARQLVFGYSLVLFTVLGFLYDIYYLQVLGIATTFLPLVVYLMYYFYQSVPFKFLSNWMILLVTMFVFDVSGFALARLFHLTNLSLFIFVFNGLLPSMIFNSVLLVVMGPLLRIFHGDTKKS